MVRRTGEGDGSDKPIRRLESGTAKARVLRANGTKFDALLWIELKAKRLGGHHFVRQLFIGPFIADFACRKAKLVVEVDGFQHADNPNDQRRDEFLSERGWSTLRFWNDDVLKQRDAVCETILAVLDRRLKEDVAAFDLRLTYSFAGPARRNRAYLP